VLALPIPRRRGPRRGFSLIELIIVLAIVAILAGIFVPYVLRVREEGRRTLCRARLNDLGEALRAYARMNDGKLPRVRFDPARPLAAFTGADAASAFVEGSTVAPNDVTASLWLLVPFLARPAGEAPAPLSGGAIFTCPSSPGVARAPEPSAANFRSPGSLTYSYATPFGATEEYRLTDTLRSGFVLMADANPGTAHTVAHDAPPLDMARANSPFHRRAGQNVLYSEGTVLWQRTPYSGQNNDNIYTSRGRGDLGATRPATQPATAPGETAPDALPVFEDDSFLWPVWPSR
jgi:prepilin-type N-terminal cleavage/methylation domain-containing protein